MLFSHKSILEVKFGWEIINDPIISSHWKYIWVFDVAAVVAAFHQRLTEIRILGDGSSESILTNFPGDSHSHWSLRTDSVNIQLTGKEVFFSQEISLH